MLSCGREKRTFPKTDVTVSTSTYQSMRSDLWGSRDGILFICFWIRMSLRFRVDGNNFENAPRVDVDLFIRIKKDAFSNISGYVWTGPLSLH